MRLSHDNSELIIAIPGRRRVSRCVCGRKKRRISGCGRRGRAIPPPLLLAALRPLLRWVAEKSTQADVIWSSPDRERATGADLLQQAGADQLIDNLSGGFAFNVRRQFNSAIVALRSRGQNDELTYPRFFWKAVNPYIGDALDYLRVTQEGKLWIANLYAHVFSEEHRGAIRTR